ncbi:hypothetical protein GGI11_002529, partial [Coemansia sp. RSA 2049]
MGLFKKPTKAKDKEKGNNSGNGNGEEMAQVGAEWPNEAGSISTAAPFNGHEADGIRSNNSSSIALGAEATADHIVDAIVESFERAVPYIRIHT